MGRNPCCSKEEVNRGAWTAQEDQTLVAYINIHGPGKWKDVPKNAGLKRCGKSCRLRWLNYLRPDIKRGNISGEEEELIIRLHNLIGNRWSLIAGRLPGRTDNEIKNYWNTTLRKKTSSVGSLQDWIKSSSAIRSMSSNTSSIIVPKPQRVSFPNSVQSHSDGSWIENFSSVVFLDQDSNNGLEGEFDFEDLWSFSGEEAKFSDKSLVFDEVEMFEDCFMTDQY